mgnify:FL=1
MQCEYPNFKACVDKMTGKVDDPEAYCAVLMRKTEAHCRGKEVMVDIAKLEAEIRDEEKEALELYRKGLAPAPTLYKPLGAIKAQEGGIMTFIASEESEDRMGDIIKIDGWNLENFQKNPVFMFGHNHAMPPIGIVPRVWVEGKQLLHTVRWDEADEFAKAIKGKYERGFMRGISVGFRPIEFGQRKDSKSGGMEFAKQELLEISAVAVPAHPIAIMRSLGDRQFYIPMPALIKEEPLPIDSDELMLHEVIVEMRKAFRK